MKIPEELLDRWKSLKTKGDGRKIAEANEGVTESDVSRALTKGECMDDVFEAMADYFKAKEDKVKIYL